MRAKTGGSMSFSGRKPKLRTWEQESGGWEYRTPNLRIMVHGYIGMPANAWFLTCYDLRIERMPLAATDAETAKAEGLASVMGWVRKLSAELSISAPADVKTCPTCNGSGRVVVKETR